MSIKRHWIKVEKQKAAEYVDELRKVELMLSMKAAMGKFVLRHLERAALPDDCFYL